jgi:hypothetical protein
MWVTTLGTGLVLINNNGSYKIYNSANGHMKDDSLYYVARYTLAECEQGLVIGTNSKGVAHLVYPDTFTYITSMYDKQSGGKTAYNIKKSAYYVSTSNYIILVTDNGFFFGSACGSIKETSNTTAPINWTQDGDKLSLLMPEDKKWEASMYDLTGRLVSTLKEATPTNTAIWDISNIGTGFYIIKADDNKEVLTTKIWVEK